MKLLPKHKRFCEEYTVDFNGLQAAIRAGYSKKTANQQASRLLTNANIQQYIRQLQEKLSQKTEITKERIIAEYAKLAFFDIRKLFNESGGLKNPDEWDEDTAAAVAGLDNMEIQGEKGDGMPGVIKKVKLTDKRTALDSLCKVLGFNAPEQLHLKDVTDLSKLPLKFS